MFGKKHSEETRAKIRASVVGKQNGERNHRYGVSPSEEQKEQQRNFMTGRKFVNKDGVSKCVAADEVETYLKDGWARGCIKRKIFLVD
jgi:hypothetical protein